MPVSAIIPRPFRDFCTLVEVGNSVDQICQKKEHNTTTADFRNLEPKLKKIVATCLRTGLAAVAAFTILASGSSVPIALTLGAIASVPCTVLVGGAWLLSHGIASTIAALATGSFITLAEALICGTAGAFILEVHDEKWRGIGLLDQHVIVPLSEKWGKIQSNGMPGWLKG